MNIQIAASFIRYFEGHVTHPNQFPFAVDYFCLPETITTFFCLLHLSSSCNIWGWTSKRIMKTFIHCHIFRVSPRTNSWHYLRFEHCMKVLTSFSYSKKFYSVDPQVLQVYTLNKTRVTFFTGEILSLQKMFRCFPWSDINACIILVKILACIYSRLNSKK